MSHKPWRASTLASDITGATNMSQQISTGWIIGAILFTVGGIILIFVAYFFRWYELPQQKPKPASLPQRFKARPRVSGKQRTANVRPDLCFRFTDVQTLTV
jgi:hypothetical protein